MFFENKSEPLELMRGATLLSSVPPVFHFVHLFLQNIVQVFNIGLKYVPLNVFNFALFVLASF